MVVDVPSFTTQVTMAAEAGTRVFPYRWPDGARQPFAQSCPFRS
ncbi:hypothetical protein ABZV64_26005 [Streptomyces sp. NPDC004959]|nr:hypothetical protein [Streptomyces sp. NRRL F-5630]